MISSLLIAAFLAPASPADRFNPLADLPIAEVRPAAPVKVAAAGWHVYRCPAGHEWSHTDASYGNRADHTCPVCGRVEWNVAQRNVRIITPPVKAAPASKPVGRSGRFNPLAIDTAEPTARVDRVMTMSVWCPPGRT